MKTLRALLILVGALSVCAALSAARAAQENRNGVGEGLAERIQDLHLTDEQETKIADIQKEYSPKVEEAAKELSGLVKEEMEKIHPVLTPEQREKLQALRAERKEHREHPQRGRWRRGGLSALEVGVTYTEIYAWLGRP